MTDQEKIKKEAKQIMDSFIQELEKISFKEEDFSVKKEKNIREKIKTESNPEFRERMLKNAPKVKDNFILAEKKKW